MERENKPNVSVVESVEQGWTKPKRVESFSTPVLTLAELMDPRVLKGLNADALRDLERKRKQSKKLAVEGELIPIPGAEPPPSLKAIGSKLSEIDLKATLVKMASFGVRPMASVQRDRRDPHFKKGAGLSNLFSYAPTFTTIGKDADMFMSLAQLPLDKFDAEHINRVRHSLLESNKWTITNAPQRGLITRVCEGLARPKPPFKPADYLDYVKEMFPVEKSKLRDLRGQGISDLTWLKLDPKSGSGVPFMRPKTGAGYNDIPGILEISAEILKAISEGTIAQWAEANPSLQVVLLRNKLDKYLVDELSKKIRPYYTYPAHWNVLFMAIWQPIAEAAVMWLDDPQGKSINAHGFSWSRGGAQRLYDWIRTRPPGFHAVAYSDDMIWVFVTKDGKIFVSTPDFKMMDMSLGNRFGELTNMWLKGVMENLWDKTWSGVGELNCRQAFRKLVCVSYALMYLIENGLGSGIAGTPEFDQVASCAFIGRLKKKFFSDVPLDEADIRGRLEKGVEEGRKYLGLEIKKETLTLHEFKPDEDYEWLVFLGHALRKYQANGETFYVPVRPYDKIVLSLVSPKGSYSQSGVARTKAMMMRAVGIMASGGWFYPELYFAAARIYNVYAVRGLTPAPENDMMHAEFMTQDSSIPIKPFKQSEFPSREWFASLVCPHDIVVEAIDRAAPAVDTRPQTTVADLFNLGGEWEGGAWADAVEAPMDKVTRADRLGKDVGATNLAAPKPSDQAHLGRVQPLTEEQKRAYNDAIKAARLARRAMYVQGTSMVHDIDRGGKLAKFMSVYDEKIVNEYEEAGLENLDDYEETHNAHLTDAELDELHAARIAPSMIRGYYRSNE